MLSFGFVAASYIAASVLFILSLGGLSGQESAKRAVWYGISGMAIAVFATILAAVSILIATINIVGGFLVTRRMLAMFQKS